jgi:hypothetical protein
MSVYNTLAPVVLEPASQAFVEGEAYAARLRVAVTTVRYDGITRDFSALRHGLHTA